MSKIEVTLKDEILTIQKNTARSSDKNKEIIQLENLKYGKEYQSKIIITSDKDKETLLLLEEMPKIICNTDGLKVNLEDINNQKNVVIVYSTNNKLKYSFCSAEKAYKKLIKLKFKVLKIKLNKKRLKIKVLAFLVNKYDMKVEDTKFYIDGELYQKCTLQQYKSNISKTRMLRKNNIHTFTFKIEDIIKDESTINGSIRFAMNIGGVEVGYKIAKRKKKMKNKQHYYAPLISTFSKDFAIHIRRTIKGNLVLVNRLKEPIERTLKFKVMESKFVSGILYGISKILIKLRKKKINLFYEKFASKAEEGTYDLFLLMQKNKNIKNYFVISEDSEDYKKIKDNKGVVRKYSLKYYWLIYNANNFISTEAPIHLNILRSNNSSLRKSITDKPFIFLQHGVTYMKCQGKNSTFSKNKEGQVSYIVVGSEKEKEVVVESLGITDEQVLKTGLPIFSKARYNHINQESDDYITIMLTWKPYEEQLYDFEKSSYYQNIIEICKMLEKYIDREKILIIAHPKAQNLLENTNLKNSIWNQPISKALERTKLLITDYSSVCYNTFYQGGGVVFYQPDLVLYESENGVLIPSDDEYIGKRAFDINQLEDIIKSSIIDKKINLDKVRTEEFVENYKTINEFSDGKNIERIYEKLLELKLI